MKTRLIVCLGAALALGLVGCNGGGGEPSNTNSDFVTQMAMKTQGDASKLTPEERKRMDELTKGGTVEVLKFHPASQMRPVNPK